MADIVLTIDPDDTAFALHDRANGRRLMGFDAPVPETDSQWAYSADTEGERRANLRYRNRTITADVLLDRSTAALLEALENTLGQKIGKLAREGGELRFGYPTGTTITFNVLEASFARSFDIADMAKFRARYEITFLCEPFGLGAEEDLGDNTETTLPCLVFTEATVDGDVPALGRLVIDEDDADNQWWLTWGIQSRYYSNSANAALFYEAEGRTALGGSATAAGPSGASGGGSNVMRNTALQLAYQAILSTQATGAGAHLSHVGAFRVYARVQVPTTNTGTVSVALEWSEGDFIRWIRNTATDIDPLHEGRWRLVDLGLVGLTTVTAGTQRWEGRVIAKSTFSGDDIDVDYLFLVPVSEGSGIASGVYRFDTPTSFSARDDFASTTAGNNLSGRVAPAGGTWATSGDATDFVFADAPEQITRTTTTGGSSSRYAVLGSTNYTDKLVQGTVSVSGTPGVGQTSSAGLFARWVDSSNNLRIFIQKSSPNANETEWYFYMQMVVAATSTFLDAHLYLPLTDATRYTISALVSADGHVLATLQEEGEGRVLSTLEGFSAALATGGALDDGLPGFYDNTLSSAATTRTYDELYVSVPARDAAMYASQSLEIRHDRVRREDSGGTLWLAPSSYVGDYLLVPPSGAEARTNRIIIKASRNDPFEYDPGIDDISARLFVTPRYLVVPQA